MAVFITGIGTNQPTLVLEPREIVSYPTYIDPNWNRIRIGVAWSLSSTDQSYTYTGVNTIALGETYNDTSYFGLQSNNLVTEHPQYPFGSIFNPFTGIFAGVIIPSNTKYNVASGAFLSGLYGWISGANVIPNFGTGVAQNVSCFGQGLSSPSGYASYFGLQFELTNKGQTGQTLSINSFWQSGVTPCMYGMKLFMDSLPNNVQSFTGYFNTGFSISGGPITLPTSLFIDMKTFSNVLKIYDIVVAGAV